MRRLLSRAPRVGLCHPQGSIPNELGRRCRVATSIRAGYPLYPTTGLSYARRYASTASPSAAGTQTGKGSGGTDLSRKDAPQQAHQQREGTHTQSPIWARFLPNGGVGGSSWRDTLLMGALVLFGTLLYDALVTNKDTLIAWVREAFVVTLEVRSSQDEFFVILEWLAAANDIGKRSRNLMITEKGNAWRSGNTNSSGSSNSAAATNNYEDTDGDDSGSSATSSKKDAEESPWDIAPGIGTHRLVHDGRTFWVSRRFDSDKGKGVNLSDTLPQVLTISCLARDRGVMTRLVADITRWHNQRMAEKVPIYVVDGADWVAVGTKSRRDLASVFLPADVKSSLVHEVKTFLRSEPIYKELGLPWRRGYLFHGPPGTGKSSLIAALASEFRLPVYLMSFKGQHGDGGGEGSGFSGGGGGGPDLMWLTRLINSCQRPCVLVMEDLDTSAIAMAPSAPATPTVGILEDMPTAPTASSNGAVSGLLNAIDGLPATDGKLLIITANDPSRLPKALLRPGRVDRSVAFHAMGEAEKQQMAERFAGLVKEVERKRLGSGNQQQQRGADNSNSTVPTEMVGVMSPAEVQNGLLNDLLYGKRVSE